MSGHETCDRLDFWVNHAQDWRLLRLVLWKVVVADGRILATHPISRHAL